MKPEKKSARKTAPAAAKATVPATKPASPAPAPKAKARPVKRVAKAVTTPKAVAPAVTSAKSSPATKASTRKIKAPAKPATALRTTTTRKPISKPLTPRAKASTKALTTAPQRTPQAAVEPVAGEATPAGTLKRVRPTAKARAKTAAVKQTPAKSPRAKVAAATRAKRAKPAKAPGGQRAKPAPISAKKSVPTVAKSKAPRKRTVRPKAQTPVVEAQSVARTTVAEAKPARANRTIFVRPKRRVPPPRHVPLAREEIPPILFEGDESPAPPVSGPGQRYALGPAAPGAPRETTKPAESAVPAAPIEPAPAISAEPELPQAYGTQRLMITARDPHWLYAAWDLTTAQLAHYNALSRDGHLGLRIYLKTAAGKPFVEIPVSPESRNWFVHVGLGGATYVGELGYYTAAGDWVAVAVSTATLTPPETLAEDMTVEFANLPVEVPLPALVELVKEAVSNNVPLIEALQQLRAEGHTQLPEIEIGAPDRAWTPEQERALAEVISMDSVRQVWVGSLEITELVRRQLEHEISSVSAIPAEKPPGAERGQPRLRKGPALAVSSPVGGEQPPARGFWFTVNAELIIYGATESDATVTIGGRLIKLRRDGSFSYRFALPDGRYELPVVAVSADRAEARHAELRFSRRTHYTGEVGEHPQDEALKPPTPENVA